MFQEFLFHQNSAETKYDGVIEARRQELLLNLSKVSDDNQVLLKSKNKSVFMQTRSHRGSKFRGVSKNGDKWQVMVVSGDMKKYIGAITNEDAAGKLYDKYSLIMQGFKVSGRHMHLSIE